MSDPDAPRPPSPLRAVVGILLPLAGVAAAFTLLYLGMRGVMQIGGSCAEGGPFVIARPCPKGVPLVMLAGIWGGLILAGIYVFQTLSRGIPSFAPLLWPALFLSLGWNFLELGVNPPGGDGPVWGWLVCAILFAAMGGLPLIPFAKRMWRSFRNEGKVGPAVDLPWSALKAMRILRQISVPPVPGRGRPATSQDPDVVSRLERLAGLHRSGSLDDDEYDAAKRRVLEDG